MRGSGRLYMCVRLHWAATSAGQCHGMQIVPAISLDVGYWDGGSDALAVSHPAFSTAVVIETSVMQEAEGLSETARLSSCMMNTEAASEAVLRLVTAQLGQLGGLLYVASGICIASGAS